MSCAWFVTINRAIDMLDLVWRFSLLAVIVALLVGALNKSVVLIENPGSPSTSKRSNGSTNENPSTQSYREAELLSSDYIETHRDHLRLMAFVYLVKKPILSNSITSLLVYLDENRLTTFEKFIL